MKSDILEAYITDYGKDIYSFCVYLTRNRNEADDLYQQTFLTVCEKPHVDEIINPKAYFISMAVNLWNNQKRKYLITEHSISVGNPDYVDDEAIAAPEEPVTTESVLHEEGNESVNWISKDVEVVNGYATNTYYAYKDYETALKDSGLDNWFNTVYENEEDVTYAVTETEDFVERCINAGFVYGGGSFFLSEGIMTGNLAEDLTRSLQLANANNKRDYTSISGQVFTLVDEITEDGTGKRVRTYVMIAYGDYDGYICFENLKDEEIYKILDTLEFGKH